MRKDLRLRGAPSGQRGSVSVVVALSLVVLLGFAALAVDYGYLAFSQRRLQSATDAAALAGAVDLGPSHGRPLPATRRRSRQGKAIPCQAASAPRPPP
jgi:Flp pilus assembly protein TadG